MYNFFNYMHFLELQMNGLASCVNTTESWDGNEIFQKS